MKQKSVTDRLTFLAKQFDVFDCASKEAVDEKLADLKKAGFSTKLITSTGDGVLAILSARQNGKERVLRNVSVCSDVFSAMIVADPTENKMYLQWMLNVFSRYLKDGKDTSIATAVRFVDEDLPQANAYLQLFEDNKRKQKFMELCKGSYTLKNVSDPTNINQYKSLAQLFDAVDPFIEREPSAVERTLQKFVDSGQAVIPVKDRKFTLYIPKTTAASVVFANFANWCTAREGNGMFKSYTQGHKKPNGKDSDIYIIIPNEFFKGETKNLYQIHFETNQLKDYKNGQNVSIFENVLQESEGISNFFYEELMGMAKTNRNGLENNKYLDYLIQFGFAESLFELMDENTLSIKFMKREIPRLPDISKFKNIKQLIIVNGGLVELHPSVGNLSNLIMVSLPENRIKTIPKEISYLKNVKFINLIGNPIKDIPDEISCLDRSNGGSLYRFSVRKEDVGEKNYEKLKRLLPTTLIE